VFVLALACRLLGQWLLGAYSRPEVWEYEEIATNLLTGRGYTYVIYDAPYVAAVSSPLYVFLTAAVYAATAHSQPAMLVLQAILGAATAVGVVVVAGRLFGLHAAAIAGILVAVHPGFVVYAARLHSLTLDMLGFVAVVGACLSLPRAPGILHLSGVGLLFGLAGLTRGTSLFLLPVLLVWLRWARDVRLLAAPVVVLVGTLALVFLPWSVRSSVLLGQPVLLSSESTEWLWRGNNPAATGSSWTEDGRLMLDVSPPEFRARILAAGEAERIALYRNAALEFVRENPLQAAQLYLHKLEAFWWMSPSTGQLYPGQWAAVYGVWYVGTVVLALLGIRMGWRDQRAYQGIAFVLAALVVVSAVQALFYVEGRHRWGVEPLLLVLAGGGAAPLVKAATAGLRRSGRIPFPSAGVPRPG
jgi:4-amino-4-deoxy-L-arabinose transferase-like glycosyltransferase